MDVQIPCICPPKDGQPRHEQDTVTLRDTLDFRTATAMRKGLQFATSDDDEARGSEVLAILTESYVLWGISGWTVVDERNKPVPVSHSAIRERILSDFAIAQAVADAADDLYQKAILLPLLARASTSSPPTPTNGSTSRPTGSSSKRPTPLRRSSTSTSRTDATATTSSSLAGVSSSSQNSESAA